MSKYIVRIKVSELLLSHALSENEVNARLADPNKQFIGVIAGSSVTYGGDVENIIYVYAHKKTNAIAKSVAPYFCQSV
ncbi:hypothetical protein MUU48_02665 [Scandinavium sp. H11S7]|uniref:hypothetical protein n=1 Tax=Scandinavium hiltneri TaxID=2926519 RepID=UPI0021659938|nr:hypothetical protein [Scandinavium hiltneri]MCS2155846.1 hypothetical protein [Scandinavium hiltneri]